MAEDAELQKDIRTSMIIAAFIGISWFIGAEINTSQTCNDLRVEG